LEKDDLIVKRRVVQKMRFLLEDMTPIAPPTEAQLQTWLGQNAQRYQTEQTIVFDHHFSVAANAAMKRFITQALHATICLRAKRLHLTRFPCKQILNY